MKKITKTISIVIILFTMLLSGCKKENPVACFDVQVLANAGDPIYLQNCSIHSFSYFWSFGDGTNSVEVYPMHIYTESGTYRIELTAYSKNDKKHHTTTYDIIVLS